MLLVKKTINYKRIIVAKIITYVYTSIDADYAVHSDTRSNTCGAISIGHGVLHEKALVKRLNINSSMEAELLSVSEYITYNLWIMIFLHVRGYGILNNIVYQYNQSSIRMENNGSNYCTGNSIHINIRYFCQVQIR